MSDAPETIWAQCSAHQNWDDLNASRHKVDWWHEYTRTDLCIRRDDPALVALVEAVNPVMKMEMMTKTAEDDEIVIMSSKTIKNMRNALFAITALSAPVTSDDDIGEAAFDNDAVYQFSWMMREKMAVSRAKGRSGWNDPEKCSPDYLRALLYEHIYKGDPVDVANICMMLRHYEAPTTPRPVDDLRLPAPVTLAQAMTCPEVQAMVDAAKDMRRMVEEIDGAMNHGTWRDERGMRLKDTAGWVALYVALTPFDERTDNADN